MIKLDGLQLETLTTLEAWLDNHKGKYIEATCVKKAITAICRGKGIVERQLIWANGPDGNELYLIDSIEEV